jgi:sugar/nucleoside kinase (ribokinase family)
MKRIHVVSIGAAVQDVFLQGKIFKPQREHGTLVNEFALGTKNEIEGVTFATGGGATNASVTFARLGFNSWYMGVIGTDIAGRAVVEDLHHEGVNTNLLHRRDDIGTGYSSILLSPSGERTILTYRGASSQYDLSSKSFASVKPDWFYISSLSGDIASLKAVIAYAKQKKIKVAINPGKGELLSREFKSLLDDIDILSINKEEMEQLFGTADLFTLLKKAQAKVPMVVVTDGPKGSYVIDGEAIYQAGMYKDVKVVDRAGAGDAFSSGFVATIAKGGSVPEAITYGSANSTSVVQYIGAKAGILRDSKNIVTMKVQKELL